MVYSKETPGFFVRVSICVCTVSSAHCSIYTNCVLTNFVSLFTATSYTAAIPDVAKKFNVSTVRAILPFSLFLFGIAFAPLYAPHVSERVGRKFFYLAATLGMAVFTLGAAYSNTYTALAVCRFFAGLFGGSNAVQIEGTFAGE